MSTRRILLVCAAAVALNIAVVLATSGKAPGSSSAAGVGLTGFDKGGRIVLTEESLDFGAHFDDEEVQVQLVVRNRGTGPLRILRVEPGCGCSRVEPPPEPIPSGGGTVRIPIQIRLAGVEGAFDRRGSIHSDDPTRPLYPFRIRGTVRPRLDTDPRSVTLSPRIPGGPAEAEFRVVRNDSLPLGKLTVSGGKAEWTSRVRSLPNGTAVVQVHTPSVGAEASGAITVAAGATSRIVSVFERPLYDVRADPPRLALGIVQPGWQGVIRLVARPGLTWRVTGVASDSREIAASLDGHTVRVRLKHARRKPGIVAASLRIALEGAKPDTLVVPVTAYLKGAGK